MRRLLLLGSPLVALLCGGLAWFVAVHRGNVLADVQSRLALGDLYGAEIDLDGYVGQNPHNPVGEFRLGLVELALNNPVAASRELRRAGDDGYDRRAIILPLGETYRRQHAYDQALEDFDPKTAPRGGLADTLAVRANVYLDIKQIDDASHAAAAAERADPNNIAAKVAAGRAALARDLPAEAETKINRALALAPGNAEALLLQADLALRRGDGRAALAITQTLLRANPADTDARMEEARAYAALDDSEHALPLLDQVARSDRDSSAPRFLRAILADRAHDFVTADIQLAGLSNVLDDLPRGYYYLGVTKLGLGQVDQAQDAAAKYHDRSPNDPDGTRLLALAELGINDAGSAVGLATGLVQAGHVDADTLDLLGRSQQAANDWVGAAVSLERARQAAPGNVEILNRLATALFHNGRNAEAVAAFQRSLDLQPGQDRIGALLVQAALAEGNLAAAGDAVARLRRAHGETPVTGLLNADLLADTLDARGAETAYRAVLNRYDDTPENTGTLRQAVFGLMRVLGMEGDADGVQAALTGWVRQHPKDPDAVGRLTRLMVAAGQPDQAVEIAAAAHDAAPNNALLTEILARAHLAAGQFDQAETLLDRAGAATNPKIARLRADILTMRGKRAAARSAYDDLLHMAPGDSLARAALMRIDAQAGAFKQARSIGQDGLALRPGDKQILRAMVETALRQNGLKAALAEADRLGADAPNQLRSDAYAAAGDLQKSADEALDAYRQAASDVTLISAWSTLGKAGRRSEAETRAAAYASTHKDDIAIAQLLGDTAMEEHRPAQAIPYFQAVLRQTPNDSATLSKLACALLAQGDVGQARATAQRAYFIDPGANEADTLGRIMLRQNQPEQALPLLRQAALGNAAPDMAYHYAAALRATGDPAQARVVLRTLLQDHAEFDERKDAALLLDEVSK